MLPGRMTSSMPSWIEAPINYFFYAGMKLNSHWGYCIAMDPIVMILIGGGLAFGLFWALCAPQ